MMGKVARVSVASWEERGYHIPDCGDLSSPAAAVQTEGSRELKQIDTTGVVELR